MSLFHHHHQWMTISSSFSPPNENLIRIRGFDAAHRDGRSLALSVLYGVTTTAQKCTDCGEVAFRTTPGRADVPTEEATR